jgi:hypothetical protein
MLGCRRRLSIRIEFGQHVVQRLIGGLMIGMLCHAYILCSICSTAKFAALSSTSVPARLHLSQQFPFD